MNKSKKITTKKLILILVSAFVVCGFVLGGIALAQNRVKKVATDEKFEYVNPDETKAETDAGFTIDGVFDEEQYQNNNWLYLHNTDESSDVDVAMTSHFGDKGMYFIFDVTDRKPIYVNLERNSPLNSGVEFYLAPNHILTNKVNELFEIDLMPTGDMAFKKTNGKGGFTYVTTSNDIMAYLGATTKGGEVNTPDCTGYTLELFIPWGYMERFDIDSEAMKNSYVYVNPAYITSFNLDGTDAKKDRYWYCFGEQYGATLDTVYQYFRFNEEGVIGATSTKIEESANCSVVGDKTVIPGMKTTYTITPEAGYAINSVLVNGKECIKNVSYSENGDALLTVWGKTEGLVIKAAAEPVTEGNKTISGTVDIGDDSLKGVTVSYTGVNGKKSVTLNSKGKFTIADLPQGYYNILVEKEGYETIERGIYLNRDITTELKFVTFTTTTGKSWVADERADGVIHKLGGKGIVLTKASYDKFAVDVNLQYDEELSKEYAHDYFTQQRQGIRIAFSNGKFWDVNIYLNKGIYRVEYPAFAGKNSVFDSYKTVYYLSEKEVNLYTSKAGIQLKVVKDGEYANVLINGKVIAVEHLGEEFAKCTAQVGFSAWTANRVAKDYKYSITTDTKNIKKQNYFDATGGWDISGQHEGYISLQEGGLGILNFAEQHGDLDFTMKVRDYQNSKDAEGKYARTDVLFVFENGAHISFGVTTVRNGQGVRVQSVNRVADDGKQIYNRNKGWGSDFTAEEIEQYRGDGINLRIVRIGTKVYLYVNDRQVTSIPDLTNNNSGVTADMKARVTLRHYEDTGVEVVIPFKLTTQLDTVAVKTNDSANGKISLGREDYLIGDKITITGTGNEGYYCKAMKVNGKEVEVKYDGTYTFTATEKTYTVEGVFAEGVFSNSKQWDVLSQSEGIVSMPNGGSGTLKFSKPYKDIDLTIKAKDYADPGNTIARTTIYFKFENGAYVSFGAALVSGGAHDGELYLVHREDGEVEKEIYKKWTAWAYLSDELKQQYLDTGIDVRVVRCGSNIYLYVEESLIYIVDLTKNKDYPVTADMLATVEIRHTNDTGIQVDMPFAVSDTVDKVEGMATLSHPAENKATVNYVLANAATDMDLTLKVNRHTEVKNTSEKFDVLLDFANGKNISFYIGMEKINGAGTSDWRVATLNSAGDADNAGKLIYNRGTIWGSLTADEKSAFIDDTLNFRIIREGTDILLYLGNRYIGTADLTNNNSGIDADTTMKVTVRHYDDTDKTAVVDIPFEMAAEPELVTITAAKCNNGKVTADRKKCIPGDTVVLTVSGASGYYCNSLKVNEVEVPISVNGTYSFVATEESYTVSATFTEGLYEPNTEWDLSRVNEGVISLTNGGGTTDGALRFTEQFTNLDITVTAREYASGSGKGRTDIGLIFENGKNISFSIIEDSKKAWVESWNYDNTGTHIYAQKTAWGDLTADEKAAYDSATGVQLRVVRYGTDAYVYIGERLLAVANLTNGSSGVTANTKAKIRIRHFDDKNVQVDIPFEISNTVERVDGTMTLSHPAANKGTVNYVFANAVTDMDLTLSVNRHTEVKNTSEKFDVLLEFANGKNISFYIGMEKINGTGTNDWRVASLNRNDGTDIYSRGTIWTSLDASEKTSFIDDALNFRIVRRGTEILLYLGERHVGTADLTNNDSGVTASTAMKVTVRHYDDTDKTAVVDIPFEMTTVVPQTETPANLLKSNLIQWVKKKLAL